MTVHVHFVGSVGLDTAEEVFAAVGEAVKPSIKRCPDGEIGGRRSWISWQWPLLRAMIREVERMCAAIPQGELPERDVCIEPDGRVGALNPSATTRSAGSK